jgi:hypothetical protein
LVSVVQLGNKLDNKIDEVNNKATEILPNTMQMLSNQGEFEKEFNKLLVGFTSDIEKSQAFLSLLATGYTLPCPKLVAMILEADVPKDKRTSRGFFKKFFKNPFKKRHYFFFLCQKTMKVVNLEKPMVLKLGREWLKKLVPFIKASTIVINIASRATAGISVLPFVELGLDGIINTFDGVYR